MLFSWMKICVLCAYLISFLKCLSYPSQLQNFFHLFPAFKGFQGRGGCVSNLRSPEQHRLPFPCGCLPPLPGYVPGAVWTTEPFLFVHAASPGGSIIRRAVCRGSRQRSGPDLERRALCGADCVCVCRLLHPHGLLATVLLHEVREFLIIG